MTVTKLLDTITSRELTEWQAYYSILEKEAKDAEAARKLEASIRRQKRGK